MPSTNAFTWFVNDASEVDVDRILSEAPESSIAILLTPQISSNAILFLRRSFTESFYHSDGIQVAGEELGASWGVRWGIPVSNKLGGISFDGIPNQKKHYSGWAWLSVNPRVIHLEKLEREIAAARAFLDNNRRSVRVRYI
jgi:hypothetical protein